ncbi:unnamed protein product [Symbiodinium sp. KB8]|nr:unnamed protein product [Symbiodinium sp. KB8]
MTSGSSADTAWTFDGGMAMPAVEDSAVEDAMVQSVDDTTTEEEKKALKSSDRGRGDQRMDNAPAIENFSPITDGSPIDERSGLTVAQLRDQMESTRIAQQMFHQSEIQRRDNTIQALMDKIAELQQEDEGATIRVQELERQRDTAYQAMDHLNRVNVSMQESYANAMGNRLLNTFNVKFMLFAVKEYEKLTNELHEQAMTNMNLRAKVSESEFSVASLGEYLQIVRNEQKTATSSDRMLIAALREEHCDLRSRLGTSEERYEDAIRRGQDVQQRLQHVEDNARQSLPTMHEELSELRRMLKHQEDMNMKVKSEYEMYRRLPQQAAVQSSSMPTSSRATEHGCDLPKYLLPITEVQSVVSNPGANRQGALHMMVSQHRLGGLRLMGIGIEMPGPFVTNSSRTFSTLKMEKRPTSSSTSAVRAEEGSDERISDAAIAKIVEDDVKQADLAASKVPTGLHNIDDTSPRRDRSSFRPPEDHEARMPGLELDLLAQINKMQLEIYESKRAEQRLREDRDEWRLMAEDMQRRQNDDEGEGEDEEENDETVEGVDPPPGSPGSGNSGPRDPKGDPPDPDDGENDDRDDPEVTEVRISRREADKVIVPPFPTITHLDNWMSQCIANVLSACADPNQEEWMKWLSPAFRPHPDIEALNDSGHRKFKSIDVKLGVAMTAMLRAGSDRAAELYLEVNRKSNEYVRDYDGKIIKGRQIVAMMYESFRTQDRSDMIVTLDYLIKLPYNGGSKLHQFKQTWMEILVRMRREDVPPKKASRDCLYNKIKYSPAMKWELGLHYEHLHYDDPRRSYENLLAIMDRVIMRKREQANLAQTQVGLRQMLDGKDLLAAPARGSGKDVSPSAPAPKGGGGRPNKGNEGKGGDAAPVLPQSKAKPHAKAKPKKKDNKRAESVDTKNKKNIRCKFHFTSSGCKNGKDCPYSHSKKTPEKPPGGARKQVNRRVSFSSDTKFKSSNPRKSYKEQGGEIIRINMQRFLADEKRASDLEFAKHKARLKAQIFKDMLDDGKDGDRIAHLRIPGTSQVVAIAFLGRLISRSSAGITPPACSAGPSAATEGGARQGPQASASSSAITTGWAGTSATGESSGGR